MNADPTTDLGADRSPMRRLFRAHAGLGAALVLCSPLFAAPPSATITCWPASGSDELQVYEDVRGLVIDATSISGRIAEQTEHWRSEDVWYIEFAAQADDRTAATIEQAPARQLLQLTNGDCWATSQVELVGEQLRMQYRADQPPLAVPLVEVFGIQWGAGQHGLPITTVEALQPSVMADVVTLRNGDSVQGDLLEVERDALGLATSAGALQLPLTQVRELRMNPELLTRSPPPSSGWIVVLADHSIVTGRSIAVAADRDELLLRLESDESITFRLSAVRSLTPFSPATTPLVWLRLLEAEQESYFGLATAALRNASVRGTPMQIGNRAGWWGLGTKSSSTLTWELPHAAQELWLLVGCDIISRQQGSAAVKVECSNENGQTTILFDTPHLVDAGRPLTLGPLDLRGQSNVTLRVGFGEQADLFDAVDWCLPIVRSRTTGSGALPPNPAVDVDPK